MIRLVYPLFCLLWLGGVSSGYSQKPTPVSLAGNLGKDFAMLSGIVAVALIIQISFLRPKANDFVEAT